MTFVNCIRLLAYLCVFSATASAISHVRNACSGLVLMAPGSRWTVVVHEESPITDEERSLIRGQVENLFPLMADLPLLRQVTIHVCRGVCTNSDAAPGGLAVKFELPQSGHVELVFVGSFLAHELGHTIFTQIAERDPRYQSVFRWAADFPEDPRHAPAIRELRALEKTAAETRKLTPGNHELLAQLDTRIEEKKIQLQEMALRHGGSQFDLLEAAFQEGYADLMAVLNNSFDGTLIRRAIQTMYVLEGKSFSEQSLDARDFTTPKPVDSWTPRDKHGLMGPSRYWLWEKIRGLRNKKDVSRILRAWQEASILELVRLQAQFGNLDMSAAAINRRFIETLERTLKEHGVE